MKREREGHTLQATAVVHEAFLRLESMKDAKWENREKFFSLAARIMRQVLIDHARGKLAKKRGERQEHASVDDMIEQIEEVNADDVLALNDALTELSIQDERMANLVELRYFIGLTIEEAAGVAVPVPWTQGPLNHAASRSRCSRASIGVM